MADHTIRELAGLDEYRACVTLQEETWGEGFRERVPTSLLKVAARVGGVVAGAFDGSGGLDGFVFSLPGTDAAGPLHWSDLLAVRRDAWGGGLGRRLKLFQREACLRRGVRRVLWTFDPLESRNGWLNLGRLGAVAREYVPDMYGPSDSPLHRGLGTDRLVVTWLLDSARVEARLRGGVAPPEADAVADTLWAFSWLYRQGVPWPDESHGEPPASSPVLIPVPEDIQRMKAESPAAAAAWRGATRAAFTAALTRGLEVRELVPLGDGVSCYLLAPPAPADDLPTDR